MAKIDRLFQFMIGQKASDLHMLEGQPPKIRQHGHISPIPNEPILNEQLIRELLGEICPPKRWARYLEIGDMDFAYALPDGSSRFRANYYRQISGLGAVFRTIPTKVLTLEELRCPEIFKSFAELTMGLVLVTGPTGSGKSTTLAAILNHINEIKSKKIITIEDPIEFVHPNKQSFFLQREVGDHTESFGAGLRAAGREDCDVILVGEMRDLVTIALAISAAEMGVLVFGTLHTNSAAKTIDRVVNVFPADQQEQIRSMLSTSLRGIVSQQLLRTADGKGRIAAHEIMLANSAVAAAVRSGHIAKINQVLQSGAREGMSTMDDCLMRYVEKGIVKAQDAYMKAIDKSRFEKLVTWSDPSGPKAGHA